MFSLHEPAWVIRRIRDSDNGIYLTFDDGPSPQTTPAVLELLKKYDAKATFFVIGQKAEAQSELIHRIITEGHTLLSHSSDHAYSNYFKGSNAIENWMHDSVNKLQKITNAQALGFRPPAGVLNPPLLRAAQRIKLPLILWSYRYFDSVWSLTSRKIHRSLKRLKSGDIVLLHDEQKIKNQKIFLKSLEELLQGLALAQLKVRALSNSDIINSCRFA
ncbi:MAG: polysaccharide deacetylase family protein [Bdellovibrionaceae bacterium]|nr:polysaccharide deacetylase family protein [Bdellovibrio sp.]